MQRGKKPATAGRKKLAGTYAKSRDDVKTMLGPTADETGPILPEWLTPAAREVWAVDIARVVGCGATAADSHMFALYCTTMADFIASVQSGAPHNAAFRSELRKQAEMLGIAGAKSRITKTIAATDKPVAQPFNVRPK